MNDIVDNELQCVFSTNGGTNRVYALLFLVRGSNNQSWISLIGEETNKGLVCHLG